MRSTETQQVPPQKVGLTHRLDVAYVANRGLHETQANVCIRLLLLHRV